MKKLCVFCACLALTAFVSCQKQQTEEERKAEIDRQVEQRFADEHQAQEKDALAQRQADLEAREKALADKQAEAAQAQTPRARSAPDTRETAEAESGYNIFYTKLDPYGDWRETSDYGYVWQPREAQNSRNWHPYTEGRWVYTDAGWTWVSDEPFGWATYHYGRWARLRNVGWVWVPDNEWAPAWVSWRKSDDYVGWAPLPPEARFDRRRGIHTWSDNYYDVGPDQYRFVATREFGTRQTERTLLPRERNVAIISQTTNVTNITYNNTMVVNQGPNYDELRSRTQQPIERLRLEREGHVDLNAETRSVIRGEVVAIPAPAISIGVSIQRPRRVKETVAQTTIEHGWEDVGDKGAAEQARAKMKSESAPPSDAPSKTFVKPTIAAASTNTAATTSSTESPTASATATATATAAARATAATTATTTPSVTSSVTPRQSATPRVTATPLASASPTLTPRRMQNSPAPSATASPTVSASARKATPVPASSASTAASPTASPEWSLAPGATIVPHPSVNPDESVNPGQRFRSQAKKFAPPGNQLMSPRPRASASPKTSATPSPEPSSTNVASPTTTTAPAASAAPSGPKSDRKHEGGKATGNISPTSTPKPTPTPEAQ